MKKVIFWILIFLMIGCSWLIGYGSKKCNCDCNNDNTQEVKYNDLNNKLLEYMNNMYNNDKWMNGGLESKVYTVTLNDFKNMGYDVSMFVNPQTGDMCDYEKTYGVFEILGETNDGMTDYNFSTTVICPVDVE